MDLSTLFTDNEMRQLLQALLEGKTEVPENDILLVVQWAQKIRMQAFLLQMVLEGDIQLCVEEDTVKMTRKIHE